VYTTSRLGSGRSRSAMSAVVSSLSVRDMGCNGGLSLAFALDSREEKNRCMEMKTMVTPVRRHPCETTALSAPKGFSRKPRHSELSTTGPLAIPSACVCAPAAAHRLGLVDSPVRGSSRAGSPTYR
jgi:hypothetical protein